MPRASVCAVVPAQDELAARLRNDRLVVPESDDPAALVERLLGAGGGPVVLVGERRNEAHVLRAAAVLADRGMPVAVRLLPHGPAAVVLIAREVAYAPVDAGAVPWLVDAVAEGTWSGAWTPTVAHLSDPAPSLVQHVASWFPGRRGFVVRLSGPDGPSVTRAGTDAAGTARPALALAAGTVSSAVRADLLRVSGASETSAPDWLVLDTEARFGSARAVEAAALPGNNAAILATIPPSRGACTVCGSQLHETYCPYCRVRPVEPSSPGGDQ